MANEAIRAHRYGFSLILSVVRYTSVSSNRLPDGTSLDEHVMSQGAPWLPACWEGEGVLASRERGGSPRTGCYLAQTARPDVQCSCHYTGASRVIVSTDMNRLTARFPGYAMAPVSDLFSGTVTLK